MRHVRIATWNIWHHAWRLEERLDGITRVLSRENCDAVLLQESTTFRDSTTAEILAERLGMVATLGEGVLTPAGMSSVAVLTKQKPTSIHRPRVDANQITSPGQYLAVTTEINSHRCYLGSAHLAWGGNAERHRRSEIEIINQHAQEHYEEITVVAGDFNALPESSAVRYIKGLDGPDFWIDAWLEAGEGPGYTSVGANINAAVTAADRGINRPELLPQRRIDYMFVREWAYGKTGCPVEAHLIGVPPDEHSDHYGLSVELLELLNPDGVSI